MTLESSKPQAALVTNHGYAGAHLPVGGAADTGGQNFYVHNKAYSLEKLGYFVTIFTRGGFPFFGSEKIREEEERLSENIKYVYIPGGGKEFIRKEDIAIALDEELDWLEKYIDKKAESKGCAPWEFYEFINTHYWDAAVLGMELVERWKNRVAVNFLDELLSDIVGKEPIADLRENSRWNAPGEATALYAGRLLLSTFTDPLESLNSKLKKAAAKWAKKRGKESESIDRKVEEAMAKYSQAAPAMLPLVGAKALGEAILDESSEKRATLDKRFKATDTHAWTAHSIGVLKEEGFQDRPLEVQRSLKFCERRNHERSICHRTRTILATSEAMLIRFHTHFRVSFDNMFYFPPCIDHDEFRKYDDEESEPAYSYLAKQSGLTVQQLKEGVVLFETSRMDNSKRKDVLIKAFAKIEKECPNAYCFIGGGPEKDLYRSLANLRESLGLTRLFLLGFIPSEHIGPLFSLADIYVSASEMEGFGMSVAQAAAASCALVCSTRIPFAMQYVSKEAMIVPAGDVTEFAKSMRFLIENKEERKQRSIGMAEKVKDLEWTARSREFLKYLKQRGYSISVV